MDSNDVDSLLLALKTYDSHEIKIDSTTAVKHSEYLSFLMENSKAQHLPTIHLTVPCCTLRNVSNVVKYMTQDSSKPQSQADHAWLGQLDHSEQVGTALAAVFLDMKGLLQCLAKIPLILHLTVQAMEADATAALIQAKADVEAKDDGGISALDLAKDKSCRDILLLSSGWTPLMIASNEGSSSDLISDISKRSNVNASNRDGTTALHLAASGGHTETIQALLEAKASVQIRTKANETALQMASRRGHDATLRVLKNAVHISSLTELIKQTRRVEVGKEAAYQQVQGVSKSEAAPDEPQLIARLAAAAHQSTKPETACEGCDQTALPVHWQGDPNLEKLLRALDAELMVRASAGTLNDQHWHSAMADLSDLVGSELIKPPAERSTQQLEELPELRQPPSRFCKAAACGGLLYLRNAYRFRPSLVDPAVLDEFEELFCEEVDRMLGHFEPSVWGTLFLVLAEHGMRQVHLSTDAMLLMGILLKYGVGVPLDKTLANDLEKRAAALANPVGVFFTCIPEGEASDCFKAALMGHCTAAFYVSTDLDGPAFGWQKYAIARVLADQGLLLAARKFSLTDLIYAVKGVDKGRDAWYLMIVKPDSLGDFLSGLGDQVIHLDHHGTVLKSAFGKTIPKGKEEETIDFFDGACPGKEQYRRRKLPLGSKVALSAMHRYLGDALDGPLVDGEIGTVVGYDRSVKPCLVQAANGEEWWYHRDALIPVERSDSELEPGL